MLLTTSIKIEVKRGNLGFCNKKLNSKFSIGDIVDIPIDKLSNNSLLYVDVICDICGYELKTKFRSYCSCLSDGIYSCQRCKHIKRKKTCNIKYNNENYTNIKKRIYTMISKYGYYYNNRDKSSKTCLKRYSVTNVSKLESVKIKKKETMLDNWGVDNPTYIMDNKFIYSSDGYISYIKESKLHKIHCYLGHDFTISTNLFYSRYYRGSKICTKCNEIGENSSGLENTIRDYIKSIYDGKIIQSYRDELEIDIYLPELKIGFEINGLYWHSTKFKDRNYHINKTNHFEKIGIQIIHIWEDDWYYKSDILKSMLMNKVMKSNRIFARKCESKLISDIKVVKNFLNKNHIQGYNNNIKISIGLYKGEELVSIMCFNNLEGRKRIDNAYNITRFCNILNTSVIGGASKILKHFKKSHEFDYMISYAEYYMSSGDLYGKLGFEKISQSYPDYKYIVSGKREHKSKFKKEKLGIKGSKITENEYMISNGIYRVYDCGKIKFKLINL